MKNIRTRETAEPAREEAREVSPSLAQLAVSRVLYMPCRLSVTWFCNPGIRNQPTDGESVTGADGSIVSAVQYQRQLIRMFYQDPQNVFVVSAVT